MLSVIPTIILLAAFVMLVTAGSKDKTKTKPHRLSSVPNSSRKQSFFANKKLTSTNAPYSFNNLRPRLESTGCLPGSREMNPKFGCTRSSCRTKFPFTTAALCFGKQGNSCCKKVDFRKDHFEESECLSSCDVRTSGLDNHALCRQRHPATLDADCRYFYDLFKSQNGFENSFDTCCSAQYLYECPGSPAHSITAERFCDQKIDCPMATDEIGCSGSTTPDLSITSTTSVPPTTTKPPVTEDDDFEVKECPGTPGRWITTDSFCDHKVDCPFAGDEIGCSCASRLEKSKICDGILDCPDGEDEASCGSCNKTHFTCDITSPKRVCIPLRQRCDGQEQCPDGMDESLCNMLSPTQQPTEISVPKFSSGYVMRNIQNKWYPLCVNSSKDYMDFAELAFRICWMTVGSTVGDIKPEMRRINQSEYNGRYAVFNELQGKPFLVVDKCPTAQLLALSCHTPRCGRKALSLREASSTLNVIFKSLTATKNFIAVQHTMPSSRQRSLFTRNRLSQLQSASRQLQVRKRPDVVENVVGGRTVNQGAWPWVVAVIRSGKFVCGGTLISSRWIISAAHCFQSFEAHYFEIQLSMLRRYSFSPWEQIRTVHKIFVHPKFTMLNLNDDVALVAVSEPFQLNQWAAPICLPSSDYRPALGTNCTIIGWGDVAEMGPESDSLREVTFSITSCEKLTSTSIDVDTLICADALPESKKDACKGDSVSPLVCPDPYVSGKWIFAGVVGFGLGCSRPGQPAAYTRIAYHLDWISKIMDNPDSTPTTFPKTKCPGITCQRGTGACLQKTYRCDDIVDCFGAEDEMNCSQIISSKP